MPAWVVHGVRSNFVASRQKRAFEAKPNWTSDVLGTGALPHLELPHSL